jgi:hypothetical protein
LSCGHLQLLLLFIHPCQEELSIMAKLEHANIVKCYGGNLEGTNPFIVTELCMCSLDKVRRVMHCCMYL